MGEFLGVVLVFGPFALTIWNIVTLILLLRKKLEKSFFKIVEVVSLLSGMLCVYLYVDMSDIIFLDWSDQLYNAQKHSLIFTESFPTIMTISIIAFAGYIVVRFIPAEKQSPLVSALGIATIYLGIVLCILWSVQAADEFFLILYSANCIVVFFKTIFIVVYQKNSLIQNKTVSLKYKKLSEMLNNTSNLPWVALILAIPLLGIIVLILFLFGQEPNSIIKAWTETADWTLSQKTPPPNIQYDEHYLCTVAAGGHRKVVKPIRIGHRHGHRVVVNRQLCIANAFEQVLEEKLPAFHKVVRKTYDTIGYPISRHIHSKYAADVIYFVMKPLEWIFLLVLYTVDVKPEDRIAVQYPHTKIPEL